ncbi:hypothetical protein FJTKL_07870 [Diaporthe vaccinii]|uniref:Uncharacterized protein n=1 Tax=Diaporthe vaccinii TaxID=105482 RepID=A0ABR4FDQ2_9PEZI
MPIVKTCYAAISVCLKNAHFYRTFLRSIPPDRGPDLASQQLGTPCVSCKSPSCGYYTIDNAGQQGQSAAELKALAGGLFISCGYRVIDGAKKKWLSMHSLSGTFAEVVPLLMDTDRDSFLPHSHRITQQPPPSPFSNVSSAALVAASNTSSTPSPLRLEHSRYFFAPTSRAAASPSCSVTNRRDFLRISSTATGSSLRSFFNPTSMIGTPGHFSVASSTHCSVRDSSASAVYLASSWRIG